MPWNQGKHEVWRKSGETKPTRRRRPSVRSSANGVSCARPRAWRASQFRVLGEDRLGREVVAVVQREQQVAVARGVVGPQRQGVAMTDLGLRVAALHLQGDGEIGDPAMLCRCQPDRLARRLLRRDGTAGAQIDRAEIAMGGGMRRIDGECRLQCLLCGVVAFHAEQGDAEIGLWFDPGRRVPRQRRGMPRRRLSACRAAAAACRAHCTPRRSRAAPPARRDRRLQRRRGCPCHTANCQDCRARVKNSARGRWPGGRPTRLPRACPGRAARRRDWNGPRRRAPPAKVASGLRRGLPRHAARRQVPPWHWPGPRLWSSVSWPGCVMRLRSQARPG